ncbi:MAG TPA: kelch repeat-containing protein, partial [Allosphingosinicella sp.]|nr:kelch repeat-containing protein [Allosphingosinicella sp.]
MRANVCLIGAAALALGACSSAGLEPVDQLRLASPRAVHSSVVLADGRALLIGGCVQGSCDAGPASATVDMVDAATGSVRPAGRLAMPRIGSAAVPLPGGKVLIVGGWAGSAPTAASEIFDPATGRSAAAAPMAQPRADAMVALLADGRVLVAGGFDGSRRLGTAELFDPTTGRFVPAGSMAV